jgi:hypothetical protein
MNFLWLYSNEIFYRPAIDDFILLEICFIMRYMRMIREEQILSRRHFMMNTVNDSLK